jgi:lysophospholipase L1-like esterase
MSYFGVPTRNGLAIGLGGVMGLSGNVTAPTRIVATRGEVNLLRAQANTANKMRLTGRSRHKAGKVAITSIGASWTNFYVDTSRVENNVGNAVTIRAQLEIVGAPTPLVQLTFSGALSGSMPDGSVDFPSDLVSASAFGLSSIPAGQVFFMVTEFTVTSNQYCPAGPAPQDTGEGATYGDGTQTQIGTAGAIINQSGGAVTTALPFPSAVVGKTVSPIASAIFFGDSLVYGKGDGGPSGDGGGGGESNGGMFPRGAWDIGSNYALPWARQARTGTQAQQAVANYTKQSGIWRYATHFLCDLGTNDLNAGRSAAQTVGDLRTLWTAAKTAGMQRAEQMQIINRCSSSTDAWATVANQTVLTGFENGGSKKDPLNTSIAANVGSNGLDAYLGMNTEWADTVVTDKIRAPGYTTDGVHPTATAAAAMGADATTRFASWTAT